MTSLPHLPCIIAVTLVELGVGSLVAANGTERIKRQAVLQQVEADFEPHAFDSSCARAFGRVAAQLRSNGSKSRAKAFDVLASATAVARQVPLYTRNPRDFEGIPELEVVVVE